MITTRSDLVRVLRIRVEPGIGSQSEACLMIRLARGCRRRHPLAPGSRYGTKRNPLSEYMSLHLSLKLIKNSGLLSRIKWEIYFYKEVFCSFIEFRKSSMREYNNFTIIKNHSCYFVGELSSIFKIIISSNDTNYTRMLWEILNKS